MDRSLVSCDYGEVALIPSVLLSLAESKAEGRCRGWAGDRLLLDLGVKMEEKENGDRGVAVSQLWVSVE